MLHRFRANHRREARWLRSLAWRARFIGLTALLLLQYATTQGGPLPYSPPGAGLASPPGSFLYNPPSVKPDVVPDGPGAFLQPAPGTAAIGTAIVGRTTGFADSALPRKSFSQIVGQAVPNSPVVIEPTAQPGEQANCVLEKCLDLHAVTVALLFDKKYDVSTLEEFRRVFRNCSGKLDDSLNLIADPSRRNENNERLVEYVHHHSNQVLTLVTHIVGQDITVETFPSASNTDTSVILQLPLKNVLEAARAVGSTIIVVGCEAGRVPGISGPLEKVNSFDMANQICQALKPGQTWFDFFRLLSTEQKPFAISSGTIADISKILKNRKHQRSAKIVAAAATAIGGGVVVLTSLPEEDDRAGVPSRRIVFYVGILGVGLVSLFISFQIIKRRRSL